MENVKFNCEGSTPARFVTDLVIIDFDEFGATLGVEIIGYSYISGVPPREADFKWLSSKVISLSCDVESDVMSFQIRHGDNFGQRRVLATFGFDGGSKLLSFSLEEAARYTSQESHVE